MPANCFGNFHASNLTANAGTAITCLIPPRGRSYTLLTGLLYRAGVTAHTITLLKALGVTTLSAAVSASGTSITLTSNPGTNTNVTSPAGALANSDWLCIELDDDANGKPRYFLTTVSSLSTLTMTVDALPYAAAAGNRVWYFGVPADHASSQTTASDNTLVGSALPATASIRNDFAIPGGLCKSRHQDEPLLVHSDNASNAGKFELIAAEYTQN